MPGRDRVALTYVCDIGVSVSFAEETDFFAIPAFAVSVLGFLYIFAEKV